MIPFPREDACRQHLTSMSAMACAKGIARREMITFAAVGLSVLALAVPVVWVSRARMAAISTLAPVLRASAGVSVRSSDADAPAEAPVDAKELQRLRRELVLLEDRLRSLEIESARDGEFRLRARSAGLDLGRFVEATVIGHAANWRERTFIIDRGSADGVVPRSGVLAGGAVAGVVVEVGPRAARVAMLAEPGVQVAARTAPGRAPGLLLGVGDGCELTYVERSLHPRPRQTEPVVTSGMLGFFPPGFLIGRVERVGVREGELHLGIAVRPELRLPPEGRVWVLRPGLREVGE